MIDASNAKRTWVHLHLSDVVELERELTREIMRATAVLDAGNAELALRQTRPRLVHLKRMRAGVRRHLYGCEPEPADALSEIARHAANIQRLARGTRR